MIEAQQVEAAQRRRHARAPERESVAARLLPVVERIAPQLAVFGKIIRRHAGQQRRCALLTQLELRTLRPCRHRIGRDIDRCVAVQANAPGLCVTAQGGPLQRELPLAHAQCMQFAGQRLLRFA